MPLQPADQHRNAPGQQAVPEIAAKKEGKAGSRQHAARPPQSGVRPLGQDSLQLGPKLLHGRRRGADAAAEGVQLLQSQQVVPGGLPQPPGLGLGRQPGHGQGDHDAGSDDKNVHVLGPVGGGNAVQGVFHPEDLCAAVLQRFAHAEQDAEKLADLSLAHGEPLFSSRFTSLL